MPLIISAVTPKGGVGKTTTICGLALYLANEGKKVLAIDLDNIRSLSNNFLGAEQSIQGASNVTDLFKEPKEGNKLNVYPVKQNIDLIQGHSDIAKVNKTLDIGILFNLDDNLKENLDNFDSYDYILIDTPAGTGNTVLSAMFCSDVIYSPIDLDNNALNSLTELANLLDLACNRFHCKLKWAGFVINRVQKLITTENGRIPEALSDRKIFNGLVEEYGDNYLLGVIGLRNPIKKAISNGVWEFDNSPSSKEALNELNIFYKKLMEYK